MCLYGHVCVKLKWLCVRITVCVYACVVLCGGGGGEGYWEGGACICIFEFARKIRG